MPAGGMSFRGGFSSLAGYWFALDIKFADFRVTQGTAEQLKFIKRSAEISDQDRGGVRKNTEIVMAFP